MFKILQISTLLSILYSSIFATEYDYGDAIREYGYKEARHKKETPHNYYLGSSISFEDKQKFEDEDDGIEIFPVGNPEYPRVLRRGEQYRIQYTVSKAGHIGIWLDRNRDGNFSSSDLIVNKYIPSSQLTGSIEIPKSMLEDALGMTFLRVRFSSKSNMSPYGEVEGGEVEDYPIIIEIDRVAGDYGDAPLSYGLPYAKAFGSMWVLGDNIDLESAPWFDDTIGDIYDPDPSNDEDGVTIDGKDIDDMLFEPGKSYRFKVVTNIQSTSGGVIGAWMDFNGNGQFDDPSERFVRYYAENLHGRTEHYFNLTIPTNSKTGETYIRFRLASKYYKDTLDPLGMVIGGEVTDYRVYIGEDTSEPTGEYDYGDAPISFGYKEAKHTKESPHNYSLETVTFETEQQFEDSGDNGLDFYDYKGSYPSFNLEGNHEVYVSTSKRGYLRIWFDLNRDGNFSSSEMVTDKYITTDDNVWIDLNINIPSIVDPCTTFIRARFSNQDNMTPDGMVEGGEVEDYQVIISNGERGDYGDAPTSYGIAYHKDTYAFYLGDYVDLEWAPWHSDDIGDIYNPSENDDEDGVTIDSKDIDDLYFEPGKSYTLTLKTTLTSQHKLAGVVAWMDFNGNGRFDHPSEQFFKQEIRYVGKKYHQVNLDIPQDAQEGETYIRFRIVDDDDLDTVEPYGGASSGEVEDYRVYIGEDPASEKYDYGDAPSSYGDAMHTKKSPKCYLGWEPDYETTLVRRDEYDNEVDEDGLFQVIDSQNHAAVNYKDLLIGGTSDDIQITGHTGGGRCRVRAWLDFNQDGTFEDSEKVYDTIPIFPSRMRFNIPYDAQEGETYLRVRIGDKDKPLPPTGVVEGGEVEDYIINLVEEKTEYDYSYAPASYGLAKHKATSSYGTKLGVKAQFESTLPSYAREKSELDGVQNLQSSYKRGETYHIKVAYYQVMGPSYIKGWIDTNGNGRFDDSEMFAYAKVTHKGKSSVIFALTIPSWARTGWPGIPRWGQPNDYIYTYMRFRISGTPSMEQDGIVGGGEVEDYLITIEGDEPSTEQSFLDAWDSDESISTKYIKTKELEKSNKIKLISLDESGTQERPFLDQDVKYRLVYPHTCPDGDEVIPISTWVKVNMHNKSSIDVNLPTFSATKEAKVQFEWEDSNGTTNRSCSTDSFAIRPKSFKLSAVANSKRAGDSFELDVKAQDYNLDESHNYNEQKGSSFTIEYKDKKSGCITGVLDHNISFKDGSATLSAKYSEVGEIDITIKEVEGKEFALIDSSDTPLKDRLIEPSTTSVTSVPKEFLFETALEAQSSTDNFTLYSDDPKEMGVTLTSKLTAINASGDTTKNYSSSCYADDISHTIGLNIAGEETTSNYTLSWYNSTSDRFEDVSSSFKNFSLPLTDTFNTTLIEKKDFSDGMAENISKFTLKRDSYDKAKDPTTLTITTQTLSNGDIQAQSTDSLMTQFYYGRIHAPSPQESITIDINASLYYEVFCKSCIHSNYPLISTAQPSVDSANWYILPKAKCTTLGSDMCDFSFEYFLSPLNIDSHNKVDENRFYIMSNTTPSQNRVFYKPTKDFLLYDKYNSSPTNQAFDVVFKYSDPTWAGRGEKGEGVDTDISRINNQSVDW
jgi:hypothetical protein